MKKNKVNAKLISFILALATIVGSISAFAWDYKYVGSEPITDISVSLDGTLIEFDVPPQIINDRTMVPMRAIYEALGYNVEWNGDTQSIHAINNETEMSMFMQIDNSTMLVEDNSGDGVNITLDSPPVIVDGRTLVPVRAISEATGCKVVWEPDIKYVHIASMHKDNYEPELVSDSPATMGNYYTESICDNRGRRWVTVYAEYDNPGEELFIETQNGEYLWFSECNNFTVEETEDGFLYSMDFIPFPDTYEIYCYPAGKNSISNMRTQIVLDWNRS